ncbi:uncharacterized [Tachysurus ichikawai]
MESCAEWLQYHQLDGPLCVPLYNLLSKGEGTPDLAMTGNMVGALQPVAYTLKTALFMLEYFSCICGGPGKPATLP